MIKTKRMTIRMASDEEMREMIATQSDNEMKKAYGEMLQGCIDKPEQRQWYAAWLMESADGKRLGDLCFKGLNKDGMIEIGYGVEEEYWGRGYATEAVTALVNWASEQDCVERIEAETEANNIASQRVLEKCGFVLTGVMGEEGPRFIWRGNILSL